jgi:hypothetical protein
MRSLVDSPCKVWLLPRSQFSVLIQAHHSSNYVQTSSRRFGINYHTIDDANHLLDCLRSQYVITTDWKGSKYIGITINHDSSKKTIELSMPGYVEKALERFQVPIPHHAVRAPTLYIPPSYGSKKTQATYVDTSPAISIAEKKRLQEIIGVLLYYARAVDPTILYPVNKLSSLQSKPTQDVATAADRLLQYLHTYPSALIVYHPSDMTLHIHSDASYLSESESRSRGAACYFLGDNTTNSDTPINGLFDCFSAIIPTICSGAHEAEYATLSAAQTAEGHRTTLASLGYPQSANIIRADNECAVDIANNTVKQRRSKAIDMRYHWIRDRVKQEHFKIEWCPGLLNLADYFTKVHPVHHYVSHRQYFVNTYNQSTFTSPSRLQRKASRLVISRGELILTFLICNYLIMFIQN